MSKKSTAQQKTRAPQSRGPTVRGDALAPCSDVEWGDGLLVGDGTRDGRIGTQSTGWIIAAKASRGENSALARRKLAATNLRARLMQLQLTAFTYSQQPALTPDSGCLEAVGGIGAVGEATP
jgi:hypothetical protein